MTPTCIICGLHGKAGCYLRFSKCRHPRYVYEKRQVGQGATDWCIAVYPKPRPVVNPEKETCSDWRDAAGRSADEARRAITGATG